MGEDPNFLQADDTVRAMSASLGMMTLGRGFVVLTEIMQGFRSLVDFHASVERIRAMREDLHNLVFDADWSADAEDDY